MRLLVNGDSFVFGDGLLPPGDPGPWKSDGPYPTYALRNGWPALLARSLGWDLTNLSVGLGSNDRMVRTTMHEICANGARDTVVLLGWTDHFRRELHCIDHPRDHGYEKGSRWLKMGSNSHNMEHVPGGESWYINNLRIGWDHIESTVRFCQQVLLLTTWLSSLGIPSMSLTTLATPMSDHLDLDQYGMAQVGPLFGMIDWSSWMSYEGGVDNAVRRIALATHGVLPCGHPTQLSHEAIAAHVLSEMASRGLT